MIGSHERGALAPAVAVIYGGTASPASSELQKQAVVPAALVDAVLAAVGA